MAPSRAVVCLIAGVASGCASTLTKPSSHAHAPYTYFSVAHWASVDRDEGKPFSPLYFGEIAVAPEGRALYVAGRDRNLHALDRVGTPLWEVPLEGESDTGPALADGILYVATANGKLLAIDAEKGGRIWSVDVREELTTRPVVTGDLLLLMGASEALLAFDRKTGAQVWQYRREVVPELSIRGAARPLVLDDRVFAGFSDGAAVALSLSDGVPLWEQRLAVGGRFVDADASPVADGEGKVFFASVASGVFALDKETGSVEWKQERKGITHFAFDTGRKILIAGGGEELMAFDAADGSLRWKLTLPSERYVSSLALSPQLLFVATGAGPLMALDPLHGRIRQSFDPGRGVAAPPSVELPGHVLVVSNRGYLYDLALVPSSVAGSMP